jgi:hypothetical protein
MNVVKRWLFRWLPDHKKVRFLQNKGSIVGVRAKGGRTAFIYMLGKLFVEVIYRNDTPGEEVERIFVFSNVRELNGYLEQEFRKSF